MTDDQFLIIKSRWKHLNQSIDQVIKYAPHDVMELIIYVNELLHVNRSLKQLYLEAKDQAKD